MLDLSHIPNSQQDIKVYNANGNSWQTWQKPRKCQWIWIMCIGGGGGGSYGAISTSATNTGGGSGAVTKALFNALDIQDILYIQVGLGGIGGVQSTSLPTPGTRSFVSFFPTTTAANVLVSSGNAGAAAGVTGDSGGTATGETVASTTSAVFLSLANVISIAGASTIGTPGTPGPTDITPLTSQIVTPGAMGAGLATNLTFQFPDNGGSILASSISPLIAGGLATTSSGATAGNGADGITSFKPFFSTGGAGGGSANDLIAFAGFGGNGGKGGIGSGGGAGGSGRSGAGIGGNGGDGIVIVVAF